MSETHAKWDDQFRKASAYIQKGGVSTLAPMLPWLLNLRGEPYTIKDHFPFEPFFSVGLPRNVLLKTGRQVSKSTSLAAKGAVQAACIPYFNRLYVTPLYEMIRRFSTNYVRPFVDTSPIRNLLVSSSTTGNVLQRSFRNNSQMYFSFAFLDADRTRGLPCDAVSYDEVQDLDGSFIPIIRETMSASKYGLSEYAGTPKTLDGTVETLWLDSSQAEWGIRCEACNYWNIPSLEFDLLKMIGPEKVNREISERYPGIVCAKCERPAYPRSGRWIHKFPDLRGSFPGYHVPQIIMPMHYADEEKWMLLLSKRAGIGNTPIHVFYNEVCGESYDMGARLITQTDLRRAATLHDNDVHEALKTVGKYVYRILAVDWGGGGEDEISFTTAAVIGMLPGGKFEVIYGWRSLTPHLHNEEARYLLHLAQQFRCFRIIHDYSGAGAIRETIIVNAGWPADAIIPVQMVRAASGPIMRWIPENHNTGQRSYYRLDKPRSLTLTCDLIKFGYVKFFKYDYQGVGRSGLLHDFLSLVEDRVQSKHGVDLYTVIRNARIGPDDFAQAVNIGLCGLCYYRNDWPSVASLAAIEANRSVIRDIEAEEQRGFTEDDL
jgi:hypothetical protein